MTNSILSTCCVTCNQLTRVVLSWATSFWPRSPYVPISEPGLLEEANGRSSPASSDSCNLSESLSPSYSSPSTLECSKKTKKYVWTMPCSSILQLGSSFRPQNRNIRIFGVLGCRRCWPLIAPPDPRRSVFRPFSIRISKSVMVSFGVGKRKRQAGGVSCFIQIGSCKIKILIYFFFCVF